MSQFEFPDCMHALAAAFHMQHIDPREVVITLPHEKWWALYNVIERKYQPGILFFDGRGIAPEEFCYMGFTFKAERQHRQKVAA